MTLLVRLILLLLHLLLALHLHNHPVVDKTSPFRSFFQVLYADVSFCLNKPAHPLTTLCKISLRERSEYVELG